MRWDPADPLFARASPARAEIVDRARSEFPWVTEDYWSLLRDVGSGEFGGVHFYEGLVRPEDAGFRRPGPPGFVAFGDMDGDLYGFLTDHGDRVFVVEHEGGSLLDQGRLFARWLESRRRLGEEDEEDGQESNR